jgi:peroxiredoxin
VEKMFKEFKDRIAFIGISQDDKARIEDFVKKFQLSFPIANDADKRIFSAFDARVPTHILIDKQGIIRYLEPSSAEIKDLEKVLK